MSTQATPAAVPKQSQPKKVPPLTDSYRQAQKTYILVAGLLASWQLIGISLDTKDRWGIELKSLSAVPVILFTLLVYSGYRMTIEWLECDADRRSNPVPKLDNWVAHGIALTAVIVGTVQSYFPQTRIADVLTGPTAQDVLPFLLIGALMGHLAINLIRKPKSRLTTWRYLVGIVLTATGFIMMLVLGKKPFLLMGAMFLTGIGIGIALTNAASLKARMIPPDVPS